MTCRRRCATSPRAGPTSPGEPNPAVVLSTHMDTVPPFIPSSEDATRVYGRGSCDAKGIIAAKDVIYYLSVVALCLLLSVRAMQAWKWR